MTLSKIILILYVFFTVSYLPLSPILRGYGSFLTNADEEKEPLIKKTAYKKLIGHEDLIVDVKFLKNGSFITASYDGDIKFWDKSGALFLDLESKSGTCCFDIVDKKSLVLAKNYGDSSALHLLDFNKVCYSQTLKPKKNIISSVLVYSPKHIFFVANPASPSRNTWSHVVGIDKKSIYSCKGMHLKAKKIKSGNMLIIGNPLDESKKSVLGVMDLETKKIRKHTLSFHYVLDVALVDDTYAWLSCGDNALRLYDLQERIVKKTVKLKNPSYTIAASKEYLAVSSGCDVVVHDAKMTKKYCQFILGEKYNYVPIIAFSPDGRLVIAGSSVNDALNEAEHNDVFIKNIVKTSTKLTYFLY